METRTLGREGFTTSPVGLGCMGLSQGYRATDTDAALATIHAALDAGVSLLDTAMSYGAGANEELVGAALAARPSRRDVQIATKVGVVRDGDGPRRDADPRRIPEWCEASLRRLGVDQIDLYFLHRVDPRIPVEETIGALADLVAQGKVRHLGVSEVTEDELRRADDTHPITAVQLEWSLMWREPETGVLPLARSRGIGIMPFSPLGRGLLGGRLGSDAIASSPFRAADPRFDGDNLQTNLTRFEALAGLAAAWGHTPAQVALAWLLAQGDDVVPIPGSRSAERARENARAMEVRLDRAQLDTLERSIPAISWVGDRSSFAVPVTTRSRQE